MIRKIAAGAAALAILASPAAAENLRVMGQGAFQSEAQRFKQT